MSRSNLINITLIIGALLTVFVLTAIGPALLGGGAVLGGPTGGSSDGIGVQAPQVQSFEYNIRPIQLDIPVPLPGATLIPGIDRNPDTGTYAMEPLSAIILLSGAIIGPVIGTGIALFVLTNLLTNITKNTKEDEEFQQKVAALEQREKDFVKENKKTTPPMGAPATHERPGWAAVSSIYTAGLMVAFFAVVIAANFGSEPNLMNVALYGAAITMLIGLFFTSKNTRAWLIGIAIAAAGILFNFLNNSLHWDLDPTIGSGLMALGLGVTLLLGDANLIPASKDDEARGPDWGLVWVVFTGAIILVTGLGIMMWVRSQPAV